MAGITDLQALLHSMEPVLKPEEYVFITLPDVGLRDISEFRPISVFHEEEGFSLIINRKTAEENGVAYDSVFRLISLHVHSSLDAVGLTAAFSTALAEQGISANVVAAYYHDHIFVPADKAERAMSVTEKNTVVPQASVLIQQG